MKKFFIGKKIGMTQMISEDGLVVPVTVLQAEPCVVVDLQESRSDGVTVVLGAGALNAKRVNKPKAGFYSKKGIAPKKYLKGFRVQSDAYTVGSEVTVDIFGVDETVNIRAKTIGRGFTGTIKRHNFSRGPMSHGSKSHRIPGSIGAGTTPGRVYKGVRMAGHYGDSFVTIKNIKIVKVDTENKLIFLAGAVPGKTGFVEIFS